MERLEALLDVVVPGYVAEGKSYLTDRGGVHRRPSPLRGGGRGAGAIPVEDEACRSAVSHRDLERSG